MVEVLGVIRGVLQQVIESLGLRGTIHHMIEGEGFSGISHPMEEVSYRSCDVVMKVGMQSDSMSGQRATGIP